jgi:hypothetical protein
MPTPSSNHAALALLRADPDAALSKFGFLVIPETYLTGTVGGPCLLHCEPLGGSIFKLVAKPGFGDFYFPYITTASGFGECTVPPDQLDGCIVTTGGMNGCALQVNRSGKNLHFYHDNNGEGIAKSGITLPGTVVTRINYSDYGGRANLGKMLADGMAKRTEMVQVTAQYQYYSLNIHVGGRWRVYYSSILEKGTHSKKGRLKGFKMQIYWEKSLEFSAFKPTPSPLLTSFDA